MVALVILYGLAAVGAFSLVAGAVVLYACIRIAAESDSNTSRSVPALAGDDSHDPRLAEYGGVNGITYDSQVRR